MRCASATAVRSAVLTALLFGLPLACAVRDTASTATEYASPGAISTSAGVDAASPDADSAPVATGQADADTENGTGLSGEALFLTCAGCHSLHPAEEFFVGPHLAGIVGRETAALADYAYSPALLAASFEWDRGVLFSWIVAAESLLPGTHMLYQNHLEPDEVYRLIDFLERNAQMQANEP